jgi:hypothetical protein
MPKANAAGRVNFNHENCKPPFRLDYDVVETPVKSGNESLPPDVMAQSRRLYDLIHTEPARAIEPLKDLVKRFPLAPIPKNWLLLAYTETRQSDEANAVEKRLLAEHPDYLFTKLNRAQFLLADGRAHEVPALFGHKMELHLMYPHRQVFHVSEAVGFWSTIFKYYWQTGDLLIASDYIKRLQDVAPGHPTVTEFEDLYDRFRAEVLGAESDDEPEALPAIERPRRFGSHMPKKDRNRKGRKRRRA